MTESEWHAPADGFRLVVPDRRRDDPREVGIADIAEALGGTDEVYRRIAELRSRGIDHAANCIERELSELKLDPRPDQE